MKNLKPVLSLLAAAAAFAGCAHKQRTPEAFEARWLGEARSATALPGSARQVNEFEVGKFLVIETNDVYLPEGTASFLLDGETVLAATVEKLTYLKDFLKAAYPNLLDGPTAFPGALPVGSPNFETLDSYISGLKDSQARREKEWASERPGESFPGRDYDQLRAELAEKLEGRDALILRYVNARGRADQR